MQRGEVGGGAEVGEQQKALLQILRQYRRRIEAGLAQQVRDLDERPAVLLLRRRIHDDAALAAVGKTDAEIAAKTGVGGSGFKLPSFRRENAG